MTRTIRRTSVVAAGIRRGLLVAACTLVALSCGDDDDNQGYPAGSGNPAGVGNHCEVDADCATGVCYVGPGGGYCTSVCSAEGDLSACPPDTVCKPIQGGPMRCLLICGSASSCYGMDECPTEYCPSGSSCVAVSGSTYRACEPEPTPLQILMNIPRAHLGKKLKGSRLYDGPCRRLTLEATGDELLAPVIDGEVYEGVRTVSFTTGPRVRIPKVVGRTPAN